VEVHPDFSGAHGRPTRNLVLAARPSVLTTLGANSARSTAAFAKAPSYERSLELPDAEQAKWRPELPTKPDDARPSAKRTTKFPAAMEEIAAQADATILTLGHYSAPTRAPARRAASSTPTNSPNCKARRRTKWLQAVEAGPLVALLPRLSNSKNPPARNLVHLDASGTGTHACLRRIPVSSSSKITAADTLSKCPTHAI